MKYWALELSIFHFLSFRRRILISKRLGKSNVFPNKSCSVHQIFFTTFQFQPCQSKIQAISGRFSIFRIARAQIKPVYVI